MNAVLGNTFGTGEYYGYACTCACAGLLKQNATLLMGDVEIISFRRLVQCYMSFVVIARTVCSGSIKHIYSCPLSIQDICGTFNGATFILGNLVAPFDPGPLWITKRFNIHSVKFDGPFRPRTSVEH